MNRDLTSGSVMKTLLVFMLPYLLSCFLQSLYGLADLYITGQYNLSPSITAVAVGSQFMHMITLVVIGLATGSMVCIGHATGAGNDKEAARNIGNAVVLFAIVSVVLTAGLLLARTGIINALAVPEEACEEAGQYMRICFFGCVFVVAYNVLSSIYRGLGDTRHPLYFVIITTALNVVLDYVFIGNFGMGARGAAYATVISQAVSAVVSLAYLPKVMAFKITGEDLLPDRDVIRKVLRVGLPVAAQEALVEISFLIITMIANRRGIEIAAAVGIVEKFMAFLFLVPVSVQASVSALCSISIGAGEEKRSRHILYHALLLIVIYGTAAAVVCQFAAPGIVRIFDNSEPAVINYGAQYLRSYSWDCIFAGIHFAFTGYFTAREKALIPFFYNIAAIITLRIPVAYFASVRYPADLYPMGVGAPLGSLLCSVIAVIAMVLLERKRKSARL